MNYYYSFHSKEKMPTPSEVYSKLLSYNALEFSNAAETKQSSLIANLEKALKVVEK